MPFEYIIYSPLLRNFVKIDYVNVVRKISKQGIKIIKKSIFWGTKQLLSLSENKITKTLLSSILLLRRKNTAVFY